MPDEVQQDRRPLAWATWRAAVLLTLVVLAARVIALMLTPLELAADEAHYWEWAQRPAWSYYSKGPGVAWAIWASTAVFGDAEWALRLPAPISGAISMLALGLLAWRITRDERAMFFGALGFCLIPVFLITSMLITIDAPYLACWSVALLLAHVMITRLGAGRSAIAVGLLCGVVVGVGFLTKYTALLLLPGVLPAMWLAAPGASRRDRWAAVGALLLGTAIACLPVVVWNAQHDWPTVRHLMGHLHMAGGDLPESHEPTPTPWYSPLQYLGVQLAITGPFGVLMLMAIRRAWRERAMSLLVLASAPVFLLYLGVSFVTEPEANWPIAAYVSLIPLVAREAIRELPRYTEKLRAWRAREERPRPREGLLRRKPETAFQVCWHWSIGVAALIAVVFPALPVLERVPVVADVVPTHRLERGGRLAQAAHSVLSLETTTGWPSSIDLVLTKRYTQASLLAYYLPRIDPAYGERLTITSMASRLGDRRSSYDFFADTRRAYEDWDGNLVLLIGGGPDRWKDTFGFDQVRSADEFLVMDQPVHVGLEARGAQIGMDLE